MKLIAQKPCSFGGKKFYIGDEIPAELVLDPKLQQKRGKLVIVNGEDTLPPADGETSSEPVAVMEVVIHAEEGDLPLSVTAEGIQAVVDILTSNVDDGKPIVDQMEDGDALILLHIVDGRKGIKDAAEARAKALNANQEGTEDSEGADKDQEGTEESEGEQ